MKLLEQKNVSMSNQLAAKDRADNLKAPKSSKRATAKDIERQKKGKGCCGDGCLIM